MTRSYERLPIEVFGRHLITTGDLDPVYIAVDRMDWDDSDHRARWLIAYWCLYHCGTASYLSQFTGNEFWDKLMVAAVNESPAPTGGRWDRGSERRHWRGQQAINSCAELAERYNSTPEAMVDYIGGPNVDTSFAAVNERAQKHRGFGPWISFKIGDMLDRLGIQKINFQNADVFMFKDPAVAAKMLFAQKQGMDPQAVREGRIQVKDEVIPEVVKYLEGEFKDLLAPPIADRPVGLQEVETVLCKWKSHLNGHYPLFNDTEEIREGLTEWKGSSKTAELMLEAMPTVGHD